MKNLDTAIVTRIAAGDTIIKIVNLLCRCGYTQKPCTAWTKLFLFDVQHHTWTRVGFMLLCTVMQQRLAVCPEAESVWSFNPVTVRLRHSSIWILLETPLTSCSARQSEISQTCLSPVPRLAGFAIVCSVAPVACWFCGGCVQRCTIDTFSNLWRLWQPS